MAFGGSLGGMSLCTLGSTPLPMNMLPIHMVIGPSGPFCNIWDILPLLNVPEYGMCKLLPVSSKSCTPNVISSWSAPIPTVRIGNTPVFDNSAKTNCLRMGTISILVPTQFNVIFS